MNTSLHNNNPPLEPLPLKQKTMTDTSRLFSYSTYAVAVNYYVLRP
jgi:hypothetical protein